MADVIARGMAADAKAYAKSYTDQSIADIPAELPSVTDSDNGKILKVQNGSWSAGISDVSAIEAKIPEQASAENQLADKNFVNSSISTNTAYYVSDNGQPFTSVAALEAYTGTVTNNDYAVVTGTDATGNTYFDRYKASVSGSTITWAKEYRLNNSSFTAAQWAAISSNITALLVTSYNAHIADTSIHVTTADKNAWNGKETKGKITIGGVEKTATSHTITIVNNGVTTNIDIVGVS